MEARLLNIIHGLFLVFLPQAGSTRVELVPEKIAGFWKEVAVASDQNLVLKAQRRVEGLFLTFSGRNITVKAAYNSSGSCTTETSVGSERDTVGKFAFPGDREIQVLDTDYEHYTILKLSLLWQGRNFYVLKYFTRSLGSEDEPGFWRFREMTADQGLYMLARHGRCAELLKEVSQLPLVYTAVRAPMKPLLMLLDPDPGKEGSSIPPMFKTTNSPTWQL